MAVQTPNMFLYLPTLGVDSGITWETDVNANSDIIDGHNHSVGSGVQINPDGLDINTDLPLNGNNLISVRSVRFSPQLLPISLPADLGVVYVSGVDLYYNDENGNQIQITKGGNVNATSSGISDGTATASFVANTLVVDAASNTPANIQGASILLGNTGVSGSFYLTLSPPSALASNYSLTLPPLPPQTNVMTLTPAGTMSSISYDQVAEDMTVIGADAIATTMDSAGANIIQAKRTMPLGTAALNLSVSGSSGSFTTAASAPTPITNQNATLTTTGRPVLITFENDQSGSPSSIANNGSAGLAFVLIDNATNGTSALYSYGVGQTTSVLLMTDYSVDGMPSTYTWQVQGYVSGASLLSINNYRMTVREL